MKKFLFALIPLFTLLFGISSFASGSGTTPIVFSNDNGTFTIRTYGSSYNDETNISFSLYESSGIVFVLFNNDSRFRVFLNGSVIESRVGNDYSIGPRLGLNVGYPIFKSREDAFFALNPIYMDSLSLNPKFLYGMNFIKLFLGKSSLVDNVTLTIDRIYNDGRPSETVYTNNYTESNPYIEFWDDFDFPITDIPYISYQMKLIPKDSSGNYGNTYLMDFRLRYNDISGVWKYDISIPTLTHGGGGHERVPIEGINEYTIKSVNPTNNTIVSPPRTFYSPSVSNTYIEESNNSTEIYNYITNNYITESPEPIYSNTEPTYDPTIEFPTLTDMLSVLKQAFSFLKQMLESVKDLFVNFFQYFMFLPSWFIVTLSTLAAITVGIAIWLFVKNLIL